MSGCYCILSNFIKKIETRGEFYEETEVVQVF